MRISTLVLAALGSAIGVLLATYTLWAGWSHDPEFHSGPYAVEGHLFWLTGYSISMGDLYTMLTLYAYSIALFSFLLVFAGTTWCQLCKFFDRSET